ncbi:Inosine-uridine nucleoside N-ribohydrolase [Richelia intracellularis]|nr:Inosine-uridine nucleoside N-ribohydrolase [Richelia intracellularis]
MPVLYYQGQTFRFIHVFPLSQEEDAVALWRDLTDNRGKACVLLEDVDRFSIWGKVRLGQSDDNDTGDISKKNTLIQGSILLIQSVYLDVEDLLGARNSQSFFRDICAILHKHQAINPEYLYTVEELLNLDTLTRTQMPNWKEKQIVILLEELYRLGKKYFGNDNFAYQVSDRLVEMTEKERSVFIRWLKISPLSTLWQ